MGSMLRRVPLACAALLFVAIPAFAAEEKKPEKSRMIEEVIVTATYRETNLMDTAQSISAVTDSLVEDLGAQSIADVFQMVPALNMSGTSDGENRFTVRGVTSQTGSSGFFLVGATVGVYLDGTPVTAALGPDNQVGGTLFDIERVEVLKGPQGTLFGEGSQGGTIRYLYKQPDSTKFDAAANASYADLAESSDTSYRIDGMVNVPFGDRFALRLVGFQSETGGWIDNLVPDEPDYNKGEMTGGRAVLKYDAERFSLAGSVYHTKQKTVGGSQTVRAYEVFSARLPNLYPQSADDIDIYTFTAEVDFSWAHFTSLTSYTQRKIPSITEASAEGILGLDNAYAPFFRLVDPTVIADGMNLIGFDGIGSSYSERWVQEFRLVSPGEGRLRWTAGLFYKDSEDRSANRQQAAYYPGRYETFGVRFDTLLQAPANNHTDTIEEYAAFGEVSYDLADTLELTVGVRVSDLKQYFSNTDSSTSDTPVSPKVVLSWRPREELLTYASYATGFRPGNVNNHIEFANYQLGLLREEALADGNAAAAAGIQAGIDRITPLLFFDGDKVASYELGVKATLFDGRARVAAAAWYVDWTKMIMQEQDLSILAGGFNYYNINAGKAHTSGLEMEVMAFLTERFSIRVAGDVGDTELDKVGSSLAQVVSGFGGTVGNRLIFAPKYSASVALDYEIPLMNGWQLVFHVDNAWVASQFTNVINTIEMPSYHKTNARITLRDVGRDRWRIALFGRNLTNEEILRNRTAATFYFEQPRQLGLEVGWKM